jgi:hypothetical protein
MKIFIVLLLLLEVPIFLNAQNVSCEGLIEYVEDNGSKDYWTLEPIQLLSSKFLHKVYCYEVDDVLVVVAEFQKYNGFQWEYKKYIFCNIPKKNWKNFKSITVDMMESHDKKFRKYIFDYKCNCN